MHRLWYAVWLDLQSGRPSDKCSVQNSLRVVAGRRILLVSYNNSTGCCKLQACRPCCRLANFSSVATSNERTNGSSRGSDCFVRALVVRRPTTLLQLQCQMVSVLLLRLQTLCFQLAAGKRTLSALSLSGHESKLSESGAPASSGHAQSRCRQFANEMRPERGPPSHTH